MPRGDGTGPDGYGSMTGRRAGYCAGYDRPGYANMQFHRGHQRMGFRNFFRGFRRAVFPNYTYPEPVAQDEKQYLESEIEYLNGQLENLKNRLSQLKTSKKEK